MSLPEEQKPEMEPMQVATRGKRPRVLVSLEDKDRAIARIRNGETKAGISRELGVPESTVRGWVKRAEQRLAREADILAAAKAGVAYNIPTMSHGQPSITKCITPREAASLQVGEMQPSGSMISHCTGVTLMPKHIWPASMALNHGDVQDDNEDHSPCVLSWLKLFNDGLLNFTYIVTAAAIQSQFCENAGDPLWKIVDKYIEERGIMSCLEYSNIQNNSSMLTASFINFPAETTLEPLVPLSEPSSPNELPSATQSLAKAIVTTSIINPPPFHVTASDDEDDDDYDDNDNDDNEMEADIEGVQLD